MREGAYRMVGREGKPVVVSEARREERRWMGLEGVGEMLTCLWTSVGSAFFCCRVASELLNPGIFMFHALSEETREQ